MIVVPQKFQDIYDRNIRLNHCSHMVTDENGPIYNRFDPQYAYIDFGCSEQFDPTGDPATRRVSSETCSMAYKTRIPEVISGSEFDPFPADVSRALFLIYMSVCQVSFCRYTL